MDISKDKVINQYNGEEFKIFDQVIDLVANHLYAKYRRWIGSGTGIDIGSQTIYRDSDVHWHTYCEKQKKYVKGDIDTVLGVCETYHILKYALDNDLIYIEEVK